MPGDASAHLGLAPPEIPPTSTRTCRAPSGREKCDAAIYAIGTGERALVPPAHKHG